MFQSKKWQPILLIVAFLSLLFTTADLFAADTPPPAGITIRDQYIFQVQPQTDPQVVANALTRRFGIQTKHVYRHALNGFAARLSPNLLRAILRDGRITAYHADVTMSLEPNPASVPVSLATQTLPTGIKRINGDLSSTASGDGVGIVDVDVAILDTGVDLDHPDLNVVGGYNCSWGPTTRYNDFQGHGSHVAGTVAARDNNFGVVGVAPGARIWSVRVLGRFGGGTLSSILCGIDWVTANAAVIEVANMSLGGPGSDDGLSCADTADVWKIAICNSVAAGVTYAVAAGNNSEDAAGFTPAAYDMVITVSALADFDGLPGGTGTQTCRDDEDDTLANFSNFGLDVDLIAPGVCILSTHKNGQYATLSGTSMASPHVAGAAALFLANNPGTAPDIVQLVLQGAGNFGWNNSDDPDGVQEPLLDVSGL